jgi:hypothetical protein
MSHVRLNLLSRDIRDRQVAEARQQVHGTMGHR